MFRPRRPAPIAPRLATLCLPLALAACQPGGQAAAPSPQQVAKAFVAEVVLPQQQQLVQGSERLAVALAALAENPDAERMEAARLAWQEARTTWETGEAWAFGPAETGGFDGNLDDWPVNERDLNRALTAGSITPELFSRLTTTAKGFHGIEAVLFGTEGQNPAVPALTGPQRAYLRLAGADLVENARGLLAAWEAPQGFGATVSGQPEEAVAEILQGMVGTLEEVAGEKLGAPIQSGSPRDLESFYSGTTRADIVANLAGVHEALQRSGLLDLIRSRDARLASALDRSLTEAQAHARALPVHLENHLQQQAVQERVQTVIADSERSAALLQQASALLS
ncbi:MAG: imelysin family protein [Synechococcus sp.]